MGWRIALWVGLLLGALVFLFLVRGILLPFVLSLVIAAVLEPAVRKLRLRGYSRMVAVSLVLGAFFGVATLLVVFFAPAITRQVSMLTAKVEDLATTITREDVNDNFFLRWDPAVQSQNVAQTQPLDAVLARYSDTLERFGLPTTQRAIIDQYIEPQRPQIARSVRAAVDAMFGALGGIASQILLLIPLPILVFLILVDLDNMKRRGLSWIPPSLRPGTLAILGDIGQVFFMYLRGMATLITMFATAQSLVLVALGVPYGILLGLLTGVLYLIPIVGNILSMLTLFSLVGFSGTTGAFGFSVGSPWIYATIVAGAFFVVASIFDQFITPPVVGNAVGLHPVVSMFVVFCGGALFGLPGMVLAFPCAGAVKVILDRLIKVTSTPAETLGLPAIPIRHRGT